MIKICPVGSSLLNTPFTTEADIGFFFDKEIEIASVSDAQIIVSGTLKKLLTYMLRFGHSKKYLLWTTEPRFSKAFSSKISYPFLPTVHIVNLYNGAFSNNYHFAPYHPIDYASRRLLRFRSKKVVSVMTYQAGRQWKLPYQGTDLDLCNLRTEIAIEGHNQGILDIYGRKWPTSVRTRGQSRGSGWIEKKMDILSRYHFNLCFENTNWPYYCTEKIWQSIQGGCLPIYYGKGNRIYDVFSKDSFLDYCDYGSSDVLFDRIERMGIDEFNERLSLCVRAFNQAVSGRQQTQPNEALRQQAALKIEEIAHATKKALH